MKTFLSLLLLFFLLGCTHVTKSKREFIRAYELYNKGIECEQGGRYNVALTHYDSAILIVNTEALFFVNRGSVKLELADTLGAIKDSYTALKLDSLSYIAMFNLGFIYITQGDYEKGLYYTERSANIEPKQAYVFLRVGYCHYMLGNFTEALPYLKQHLNSKYNYSQESAYYYMGCCHEKLNNMALAESCWKKANEIAGYDLKSQLDSIQVPHLPSAKADGN